MVKAQLDKTALRSILDDALEMENDGAGCGPLLRWNAGTILEALMWLDEQGHLDNEGDE